METKLESENNLREFQLRVLKVALMELGDDITSDNYEDITRLFSCNSDILGDVLFSHLDFDDLKPELTEFLSTELPEYLKELSSVAYTE